MDRFDSLPNLEPETRLFLSPNARLTLRGRVCFVRFVLQMLAKFRKKLEKLVSKPQSFFTELFDDSKNR